VTTTGVTVPARIDRWSGGCLIAAGLLLLSTAPHPDIFESTFADAALDTPFWVVMHAALLLSAILSLFGLFGLYARHAGRLGRLGAVGFALAVPGPVVAACAFYWEAFLLPVLARHDAALFAWDGPVVTSWGVRSGALAGLWIIGFGVLGLALYRARAVPRAAALTLAVSSAAFAVLEGPFVPVLGPLATLAFAVGYAWVGAALWTGRSGQEAAAARRPRRHTPVTTGRG
jgi:hypothetical protein